MPAPFIPWPDDSSHAETLSRKTPRSPRNVHTHAFAVPPPTLLVSVLQPPSVETPGCSRPVGTDSCLLKPWPRQRDGYELEGPADAGARQRTHLPSGTNVLSCSAWHAQTSLAAKPASPPRQREEGESCQLFIHLFPLSTFQLVQHLGSICEGVHRPRRLDGFARLTLYFIPSLPRPRYTLWEATSGTRQPPSQEQKKRGGS